MKYLRQFLLILFISFLGELLKYFLPLPIPASIYGMVILFIGLLSGIIKLDAVKDVGKFLIEIMPVMFILPSMYSSVMVYAITLYCFPDISKLLHIIFLRLHLRKAYHRYNSPH